MNAIVKVQVPSCKIVPDQQKGRVQWLDKHGVIDGYISVDVSAPLASWELADCHVRYDGTVSSNDSATAAITLALVERLRADPTDHSAYDATDVLASVAVILAAKKLRLETEAAAAAVEKERRVSADEAANEAKEAQRTEKNLHLCAYVLAHKEQWGELLVRAATEARMIEGEMTKMANAAIREVVTSVLQRLWMMVPIDPQFYGTPEPTDRVPSMRAYALRDAVVAAVTDIQIAARVPCTVVVSDFMRYDVAPKGPKCYRGGFKIELSSDTLMFCDIVILTEPLDLAGDGEEDDE